MSRYGFGKKQLVVVGLVTLIAFFDRGGTPDTSFRCLLVYPQSNKNQFEVVEDVRLILRA